jgi:hypothetical protein
MRQRALLAGAAALLLVVLPGAARADGDPASDVLYTQDVFLPYPPPAPPQIKALKRSVAAVYAKHYRIKVAVIAANSDLGAVPELFGKPTAYARFLGQELSPVYVGPLLIVMRAGYGIYDGGRSTAAEDRVLTPLTVFGSSANDLASSAAQAVDKLRTAGALRSKDIKRPQVYPRPATGARGASVRIVYAVLEDSERTKETVRVSAGAKQLATFRTKMRQAVYIRAHTVTWRVPRSVPKGALRFCVLATDPAGNKSPSVCAPLTIR